MGQPVFPQFSEVLASNALSQNSVTSIITDAQGYVWVGTFDGLNRYDGYTFKHFKHVEGDPRSLIHNQISGLFIAPAKTLWVNLLNGLCKYDPVTEKFTSYPFPLKSLNFNSRRNILIKESMYFPFPNQGILPFNLKTGHYGPLIQSPEIAPLLQQGKVFSADNQGNICWLIDQKVIRYNPATWQLTETATPLSPPFTDVLFSNGETHSINDTYYCRDLKKLSISGKKYYNLYIDAKNRVWLFGAGGLALVRGEEIIPVKTEFQQKSASPVITTLYEDKAGMLWVGTDGAGLWKADLSNRKFNLLNSETMPPGHALPNDYVRCFAQTGDSLWIGTYPDGLHLMDLSTGKSILHQTGVEHSRNITAHFPPKTTVNVLKTDSLGHVWIGTSAGLY